MFGYSYERYLPFNKNQPPPKKEGKIAGTEFCRLQYSSLYVSKMSMGHSPAIAGSPGIGTGCHSSNSE
jgi:hypothetical protein